jgi:hypothetical protein
MFFCKRYARRELENFTARLNSVLPGSPVVCAPLRFAHKARGYSRSLRLLQINPCFVQHLKPKPKSGGQVVIVVIQRLLCILYSLYFLPHCRQVVEIESRRPSRPETDHRDHYNHREP